MITLRVDDTQLRRKVNTALREMGRTSHPKHPLTRLHYWVVRELGAQWRASNVTRPSRVGTETWPKFKPQYTRADGTEVPAWGGIPRLDGKGMVKGRLRPSGRRLTASSRMMIDDWPLYRAIIQAKPDIINNVMRIGRGKFSLKYGRYQIGLRKLSWPPNTQLMYGRFGREWLDNIANQWNRTGSRVTGSRRSNVA